jgi:hypothetical protein
VSNETIENSTQAPEVASPKTKSTQEVQAGKESRPHQEGGEQTEGGTREQESRGYSPDEARQRRNAGRDHDSHGLAAAHRSCICQHLGGETIESTKSADGERTYRIK